MESRGSWDGDEGLSLWGDGVSVAEGVDGVGIIGGVSDGRGSDSDASSRGGELDLSVVEVSWDGASVETGSDEERASSGDDGGGEDQLSEVSSSGGGGVLEFPSGDVNLSVRAQVEELNKLVIMATWSNDGDGGNGNVLGGGSEDFKDADGQEDSGN